MMTVPFCFLYGICVHSWKGKTRRESTMSHSDELQPLWLWYPEMYINYITNCIHAHVHIEYLLGYVNKISSSYRWIVLYLHSRFELRKKRIYCQQHQLFTHSIVRYCYFKSWRIRFQRRFVSFLFCIN